jgi:hypothetical protein
MPAAVPLAARKPKRVSETTLCEHVPWPLAYGSAKPRPVCHRCALDLVAEALPHKLDSVRQCSRASSPCGRMAPRPRLPNGRARSQD